MHDGPRRQSHRRLDEVMSQTPIDRASPSMAALEARGSCGETPFPPPAETSQSGQEGAAVSGECGLGIGGPRVAVPDPRVESAREASLDSTFGRTGHTHARPRHTRGAQRSARGKHPAVPALKASRIRAA